MKLIRTAADIVVEISVVPDLVSGPDGERQSTPEDFYHPDMNFFRFDGPAEVGWVKKDKGFAAPSPPPPPPLDEVKRQARAQIVAYATGLRRQVTGGVSAEELAGWVRKAERAKFALTNATAVTEQAIIKAEADARGKGESWQELAERHAAKDVAFGIATATIDGLLARGLGAIEACASAADIDDLMPKLMSAAEEQAAALLARVGG